MNIILTKIFFSERYKNALIVTLRLILAVIFIWFGALKVAGYNPVFDLIYNSILPTLAHGTGLIILGWAEIFIGLLLLSNRVLLMTHIILLFHLLGTFTTFLFGWNIIFDPYFPILSLDGEFVVKNGVLAVAGLVVLAHESNKKNKISQAV